MAKHQGVQVGYWPAELFTNMKRSAKQLEWGGRVINTELKGIHTTTQMGSGSFPSEGIGKAARLWFLEYVDENRISNHIKDTDLGSRATRPECYDVQVLEWDRDGSAYFLYVGPGYSPTCE